LATPFPVILWAGGEADINSGIVLMMPQGFVDFQIADRQNVNFQTEISQPNTM
jgi:hypothetical protein